MATQENSSPFSDLPKELVRFIFETSAHDPTGPGWTCALVSKEVQRWVERILYRDVDLGSSSSKLLKFHRTTLCHPSKPPGFISANVKSLGAMCGEAVARHIIELYSVLEACSNVEALYISLDVRTWPPGAGEDLKIGKHPVWKQFSRLKRLQVPAEIFLQSHRTFSFGPTTNPIFAALTHLEISEISWRRSPGPDDWRWETLPTLRTLTHLCICCKYASKDDLVTGVRKWVNYLPVRLKVCAIRVALDWPESSGARLEAIAGQCEAMDSRLVVALDAGYTFLEAKWPTWVRKNVVWRRWNEKANRGCREIDDECWSRLEAKLVERGLL